MVLGHQNIHCVVPFDLIKIFLYNSLLVTVYMESKIAKTMQINACKIKIQTAILFSLFSI